MPPCELPGVAVIADAHFHAIDSDYDLPATVFNGQSATLRSWIDTRRSSRVFNESGAALKAALKDIADRGIRHIVLLGDYTDDGQLEATQRLVQLLQLYQDRYSMQFYAIPGNHDCYGPVGKHQSTRFTSTPGNTVLVTSDPEVAASESDTSVLTRKMYCDGAPAGLLPMREFGLCRQDGYLHWESPFGLDDSFASRRYEAHSADGGTVRSLIDASYLVEPEPGLWLLMIDANVFEPRNGQREITRKKAFFDSSDAGWNAVLRCKPHLITWISDVSKRARQLGKALLSFSHYPAMDAFDDWSLSESRLFGQTETLRRRPDKQVAETLLEVGLRLHLGGHLHINGKSTCNIGNQQFTDIAVPSLAAFPPAYKSLHATAERCRVETISLNSLALDPWLLGCYRAENDALKRSQDRALDALNYGDFLYKRMYSRVAQSYLPKEWPTDIAGELEGRNVADLASFLIAQRRGARRNGARQLGAQHDGIPAIDTQYAAELKSLSIAHSLDIDVFQDCSIMDLIVDWYCLRHAGHQAASFSPLQRLNLYRFLAQEFGDLQSVENNPTAAFFHVFLGVLQQSLQRLEPAGSMTDFIELRP
ncbi:metallophosphoesterase family protein [Granulosicoccus antarcticus]|uniref:3',5'-cyclic adenosine monophosphate phosphodiesterase CpdA n=1 Tax=Granulosicoccus antarcticus IMCC3135 TaxID=1192854 RepID=A0A2Z2P7Z5_9GAMM|nr:metallophosphoesterase [Granulosicoccus antarcticus]ASJ75964.1 3',5'-cyclic adenosine monophosphate phosphodiesterase CpdA [Granulosicoccus antarcticus IMCC3135]